VGVVAGARRRRHRLAAERLQLLEERGLAFAAVEVEHQGDLDASLHRLQQQLFHVARGEIVDADDDRGRRRLEEGLGQGIGRLGRGVGDEFAVDVERRHGNLVVVLQRARPVDAKARGLVRGRGEVRLGIGRSDRGHELGHRRGISGLRTIHRIAPRRRSVTGTAR
jgi:hypothetical protein